MMKPINIQDEMYTRNDDTLSDIIGYGQPNLGMPPFGKAYGGELSPGEIEAIVTFMRYTWDDRVEMPQEAAADIGHPRAEARRSALITRCTSRPSSNATACRATAPARKRTTTTS